MLLRSLKILLIINLSQAALAHKAYNDPGFLKTESCGGIILSLFSQKDGTEAAYSGFRNFRWDVLKLRENDVWTFDEVSTNAITATATDMHKVATRIRGLEKVHEEEMRRDNLSYYAMGLQVRGAGRITQFLKRETIQSKIVRIHRNIIMQEIDKRSGWTSFLHRWKEKFQEKRNQIAQDASIFESAINSPSAKQHPGDVWVYQSANVELPTNFFQLANDSSVNNSKKVFFSAIESEIKSGQFKGQVHTATAEIDQLLYYEKTEDGTYEPVLNIFVRFLAPRPNLPRFKEEFKPLLDLESQQLRPIAIPAK